MADREHYEPPQVDDVPAEDGPAVTAADAGSGFAAEWRPRDEADAGNGQAGAGR